MPGIGNKQIGYLFNVVDVFQDHCAAAGCGGTDDDVATAENLLDQCPGITDALNFIHVQSLFESSQESAFTGNILLGNNVELISSQKYDMDNPNPDQQRDQTQSQGQNTGIHLPVIAEDSGKTRCQKSSQSNAQRRSDSIPKRVPDASHHKEKCVFFCATKEFLFFCFIHVDLLCFVLRLRRGQNMKKRKAGI